MSSLKPFSRNFFDALKRDPRAEIPAFLGNLSGTVPADDAGNVYVTLVNGEVLVVYNGKVPNVSRLPVVIGFGGGKKLQVLYSRDVYVSQPYPDVPGHAFLHTFPGPDTIPVRGEQFLPGLVVPAGSLTVKVYGLAYQLSDGWHILPTHDIDLTSSLPASGAKFALLEADTSGAISVTLGSEVTSRALLEYSDIPDTTADHYPVAAVKLYFGQTAILQTVVDSDIIDLRWGKSGGGGGGTWGSITGTLADQTDLQTALNAKEATANKVTAMSGNTTSNIMFLTAKAVYDWAVGLFSQIGHTHSGLVTNGDSHDHNGGDGAQISHVNLSGIGTLTHENLDLAVPLPVKNTSGATANANDVGYLIYVAGSGYEYKTTTTSTADLPACVVLVGGANNANVYVVNRGRFTIPYAGTAPSQGDFLVFSTTAGKVAKQATMRPEIIGVAMAGGSGGTVDALLLTQTKYVPYLSANNLYYCSAHSETTWTGTINGAPSATSVTYTTATGQKDVLTPQSTSELAKLLVYNVTRGTYRLVTANNTGTNTLTTVSSTDAWANGDSLTISDPVIGYSSTPKIVGMDLSQQTEIPLLARAIAINEWSTDSAAGKLSSYHPYETYSVAKLINSVNSQVANVANIDNVTIPLIQQRFGKFTQANGTGTRLTLIKISGYHLATP